MFFSIRCWRLETRLAILCLKSLAEAQSFGLLITSLLGLTTPPSSPSPPKSVRAEGRVAIHDHGQVCPPGCVDLGGLVLLSIFIKRFFGGGSKHRILNSFILPRIATQGTFCLDILQQHLFLFKATSVSVKAHDTLIHHCNAFAFLLRMKCHTWLPRSGAFLNTYFSCPQRTAS